MKEDNNYVNPAWEDDDEMDIDWAGLLAKVIKFRRFIAVVTLAFAVLGVTFALLSKREYTVSVILAPESQSGGSASSALSGIVSFLGMGSMGGANSSDALNMSLFPEISTSLPFLVQLFDVEVCPYVSPADLKKGVPAPTPVTLYKYYVKEDAKQSLLTEWKERLLGAPEPEIGKEFNIAMLTANERRVVGALKKAIDVEVDKKTQLTTISVTMDDPWISTMLADTVCQRLQKYVVAYRTQKAVEDLKYYELLASESKDRMLETQAKYARAVDFNRSVILQTVKSEKEQLRSEAQLASQIYNQMAQQLEMQKAKLQEVKPVFAVVEPATMPVAPSSPRRSVVVLGFMMAGFVLSAAWKLYGVGLYQDLRNQVKEKIEESDEGAVEKKNG